MSVFNDEKSVGKSIESILNQTYDNFELIIVEDASTDNYKEIIENYRNSDERIKLFSNNKNIGLTKSLNIALSYSKGEIIARQDSDDISLKTRLKKQVDVLSTNKYSFSTTRAINSVTNKLMPRFTYYLPQRLVMKYKNPFIHGTLFADKNIFEEVGGYDENFYFAQDYKFYKDCYNFGKKIIILNEVLYELNNKNNISNKHKKDQEYYFNCARKNIVPNTLKTGA